MLQHIAIVIFFTVLYYISNFLSNLINSFTPEIIKLVSFVLIGALYTIGIYLWNHFIWKIFSDKWYIPPNINGTYDVKLQSSYDDNSYEGEMRIIQTYNNICITTRFKKVRVYHILLK